jgi:hypothetical protein
MNKKRNVMSPTSINNYNNLLKHLDDKQKEIDDDPPPPLLHSKSSNEMTEAEKSEKLQELLKRLCETFTKFDTPCFTGKTATDNYAFYDPNNFENCCKVNIINKKKPTSLTEEELNKIIKNNIQDQRKKLRLLLKLIILVIC